MNNSKPKILHTMTWLAKGGGVDKNVFLNIKELSNEFEFHLAVGNEIQYNEFEELNNLNIFVCKDMGRAINIIDDIKAIFYFIKLIKKEKYDLVHTHEAKASIISRIAAYICGCKCIFGLHGVTFNDPLSNLRRLIYIVLEKVTIYMNQYIISTSMKSVMQYHKYGIGKRLAYKVIYSGIDLKEFFNHKIENINEKGELKLELGFNKNDLILINTGRFSFSKAQRFTIECFHKLTLEFNNIKLLLIGEGELINSCKDQVRSLGIDDKVKFYGFCKNISKLLSIGDIFIFTSLREGLPRAVVEASLMKIPTVAFEVEGIDEILENENSGFIVPQYNVNHLFEKSKILIENKNLRKKFGELSYARAIEKWDHNKMADMHRDVYNKLLNC